MQTANQVFFLERYEFFFIYSTEPLWTFAFSIDNPVIGPTNDSQIRLHRLQHISVKPSIIVQYLWPAGQTERARIGGQSRTRAERFHNGTDATRADFKLTMAYIIHSVYVFSRTIYIWTLWYVIIPKFHCFSIMYFFWKQN